VGIYLPPDEVPEPPEHPLCGKFCGEELRFPWMKLGTGIRACCQRFKGHKGDCSPENPDL
jgi:hypothetical protein